MKPYCLKTITGEVRRKVYKNARLLRTIRLRTARGVLATSRSRLMGRINSGHLDAKVPNW